MNIPEDDKPYNITIGKTFQNQSNESYHIMNYNIKPSSLDKTKPGILKCNGGQLAVHYHHTNNQNEMISYNGKQIACSELECFLIFENGEFRLERSSFSAQLMKKTIDKFNIIGNPTTTTSSSKDSSNNNSLTSPSIGGGTKQKKKSMDFEEVGNNTSSSSNVQKKQKTIDSSSSSDEMLSYPPTNNTPNTNTTTTKRKYTKRSTPLTTTTFNNTNSNSNGGTTTKSTRGRKPSTSTRSNRTIETPVEDMSEFADLVEREIETTSTTTTTTTTNNNNNNRSQLLRSSSTSNISNSNDTSITTVDDDDDIVFEEFPVGGDITMTPTSKEDLDLADFITSSVPVQPTVVAPPNISFNQSNNQNNLKQQQQNNNTKPSIPQYAQKQPPVKSANVQYSDSSDSDSESYSTYSTDSDSASMSDD